MMLSDFISTRRTGRWCSRSTRRARSRRSTRTQPGLPMKKGRAGTMTHDYKRHGTTTLFAALNVATGEVIGQCMKRHRHQEWLKFLRRIDCETPKNLDVHLIADNYATHKHAKVKAWLERHPRFHMHFTPTSVRAINKLKRFRRNATRYDRNPRHLLALLCLAAVVTFWA